MFGCKIMGKVLQQFQKLKKIFTLAKGISNFQINLWRIFKINLHVMLSWKMPCLIIGIRLAVEAIGFPIFMGLTALRKITMARLITQTIWIIPQSLSNKMRMTKIRPLNKRATIKQKYRCNNVKCIKVLKILLIRWLMWIQILGW